MFHHKTYNKALSFYDEYLIRYPDGHLAAEAMLKKGLIYTVLGKNMLARKTLQQLIAEYPDSPFVLDAKSQLLLTFFNEGKYQETIDRAIDVLRTTDSKTFALNTYLLLGDSYLAIGSFAEALDAYLAAFSHLDDKTEESVIVKIETASNGIGAKAIIDLLFRYEGVIPVQGLIYRLGLSKFKVKKYEDAKNLLSEAMKRYPKHKNYQKSKELIGEIDKTFIFRRHTLGCLLPLSGSYKVYGDMMLRCIELALARFASQNDNPQIKLIIKDTESDSDKAVLAVKELSNERVGAILGPVSASEAAALQAQRERIPIITFSQKEDLTDMGDYVFRNFITPKSQIKTLVSYAMDNLGLTRYAILHPDDKYGILFKSLFQQEVNTYGGEIVVVESYQAGQTDFAEIIKKISGLNRETLENSEKREHRSVVKPMDPVLDFEAIFIPDGPSTSGLIIPQLAFYDVVDVKLLGTNIWHSNRLIEMAQQFVQNAIMVDGFFAESQSQQVKNFVGNFESTFNETPGFIEAVAYDTAMMLFQLISRKDIQSRIELKNELMNLQNFDGVTGITSFDGTGDAQKDLYILQIEGDAFVEAEVFSAAEPLE
ncbi:MAG: ABC transporter substrate-binding protein [Desulfobacterales bacterium]|nr:MAG: ABC transporter substrate-binding protein [Desulfobacterales bacterium]